MAPSVAELILGGARSGKSQLAETRAQAAEAMGMNVVYVATAEGRDAEMRARIAHHRARRPDHWGLLEAPLGLANTLREAAHPERCILVDCLTLWLSNLLFTGRAAAQADAGEAIDCPLLSKERNDFLACLPTLPGRIILVSNEVGCGIVPMGASTRLFADEQGRLNQQVAARCARVTLVAAGLPLEMKPV